MRRVLPTLLAPLVLGAALLLPGTAASAQPASIQAASTDLAVSEGVGSEVDGLMRLATEAEPGDIGGLEPGGANATENDNRPDEYEPNFLWAAAVGLSVLTVASLAILAGLYRLMVRSREPSAS